jgi:hypothetical protein
VLCFGSADSTEFTDVFFVCADSKGDSGEEASAEKSMSEAPTQRSATAKAGKALTGGDGSIGAGGLRSKGVPFSSAIRIPQV